ncbi:MAG TPA: hypothetical protein VMS71_01485 [Candidatus Acidoferrum sp.]|nr:hypothetical protein [Candidatus Acidoferrum sp.]
MRFKFGVMIVLAVLLGMASKGFAQETEQDVLNRVLKDYDVKSIKHIGWFSINFGMNRINRHNDYNDFANYQSTQFTGTSVTWLNTAKSLGAELGTIMAKRFALSLGGEYWLKFGQKMSGSFMYTPAGQSITDPSSEMTVYGIYTGVQYYVMNPPTPTDRLTLPAVRIGGTAGYYRVKWTLWPEYQNLNLSTSQPEISNIAFEGSAPGFSFVVAGEYPLKFHGLSLNAELNYLYLNFKNVAWYNGREQEVVATYGGTPDSRVNLGLSGVRGKIELKKFFSW